MIDSFELASSYARLRPSSDFFGVDRTSSHLREARFSLIGFAKFRGRRRLAEHNFRIVQFLAKKPPERGGEARALQEIPVALQRYPNQLASSTDFRLSKQLLEGILDRAFGNVHA